MFFHLETFSLMDDPPSGILVMPLCDNSLRSPTCNHVQGLPWLSCWNGIAPHLLESYLDSFFSFFPFALLEGLYFGTLVVAFLLHCSRSAVVVDESIMPDD